MIITAGIYKGRKIAVPDENITRPTLSKVRMGVFNTLYSILGDFEGKTFLDVFGGSGIMGLEALSRGFGKVKVYEKNRKAASIIQKNYKSLGLAAELFVGDSQRLLKNTDEFADVAYIDPPYMSEIYESIINIIKARIIAVEHSEQINFDKFDNFSLIKQKNYGGKLVTFLSSNQLLKP